MEYKNLLKFAIAIFVCFSGCLLINKPAEMPSATVASFLNENGSTPEGVNYVVEANNRFALDLYSLYKEKYADKNILYSPFSISTAFAMVYEGARGNTAEEMRRVFHFPENASERRADFAKILNCMNNHGVEYQLYTANALWAQKDYSFLPEYFRIIGEYYGGNVTNLDFIGDRENSRITINAWVENQTKGKIKDLIPKGMIDDMTRLVLTNAIYFKGKWLLQFNESNTFEEYFKTPSGAIKVDMMHIIGNFNYMETDEVQVLEMLYSGKNISMLIILPKNGDDVDTFTIDKLNEWRNKLTEKEVAVSIPKFKIGMKYFMRDDLIEMGMPTAFSSLADFSGMTGRKELFIGFVIHQAFIEVNEEGTEASASTAVEMSYGVHAIFCADHPFLFIVQDKNTGNILFMGKVVEPGNF